jgi:hypothetical protein
MKACYGYHGFKLLEKTIYLLTCGKLNHACKVHVWGTEIDLVGGNSMCHIYRCSDNEFRDLFYR